MDESQILASVGLSASEELRAILMDNFEEAKLAHQSRMMNVFLDKVKVEFGAIQEVERMDRLTAILSFRRKADMNIRVFWQRIRRLLLFARQNGVLVPEDILFTQAICSMNLPNAQRHLVLSHFENASNPKSMANLQNLPIRCLAVFNQCNHNLRLRRMIPMMMRPICRL